MALSPVDKSLTWDPTNRAVAQAVVQHLPEATPTEAYYHLVVQHLAHVLWTLNAAEESLQALNAVVIRKTKDARTAIARASATTRSR